MAKKPSKLVPMGSATAGEIFNVVGTALSYWEASEDVLMGLFNWLCGELEPVACASYVHAPRKVRIPMLHLALSNYGYRLTDQERASINVAISSLDKLSSIRNQIAHGHVSEVNMEEVDAGERHTVAKGSYLLPSLNEQGYQMREFRFHHTAGTILAFQEEVRNHRWTIFQSYSAAMMREQAEDQEAGSEVFMQRRTTLAIAARKIKSADYKRYFLPMSEWSHL